MTSAQNHQQLSSGNKRFLFSYLVPRGLFCVNYIKNGINFWNKI